MKRQNQTIIYILSKAEKDLENSWCSFCSLWAIAVHDHWILKRVINIKQSVTNKVKNVVKTQNQTVESLKKNYFLQCGNTTAADSSQSNVSRIYIFKLSNT